MLLVISVSTCGNFDFYHVFRLPVCVCVYNIFSETVDFLIQIIPFAAIVRLCVCVCVCVWVGGSALLVLKREAVLTYFVRCVVQC